MIKLMRRNVQNVYHAWDRSEMLAGFWWEYRRKETTREI
jgi:hypothetical protein